MVRTIISFLVLAAAVAYGFGIWLFLLHPQNELPHKADAVFVLSGNRSRLPVALELMAGKAAPTLVVSEDSAANDPARYSLCHGPKPRQYELICRIASPSSTRGEARAIAALTETKGWAEVIVVTSRYHMYRARVLINRCTNVNLSMRATDDDPWWRKALAIPLEYAKLARADTFQRGC
jgi:uncharacterized SAM-binding protein YcdF (DUF218 family)